MQHSESIAALATALAEAQGEMENAAKTATNPHFGKKYADLAEIINTVRPVLAKHGLSVVQVPGFDGSTVTVESVLLHKSGEWIGGVSGAPISIQHAKDGRELPPSPQGVGSAITYLRRYSLAAVCGIAQEDDDAETATAPSRNGNGAHVPADNECHCPRCGSGMYDNRTDKPGPASPDFKCKNKQCLTNGRQSAFWWPKVAEHVKALAVTALGAGLLTAEKAAELDVLIEHEEAPRVFNAWRMLETKLDGARLGAGAGAE